MCDPVSAVIAGSAVLGAGTSYLTSKKQTKVAKAQMAQSEQQARATEQATLAGLAEMDRLLDRAERLISCQRSGRAPRPMLTSPVRPQ